MVSNAKGRFPPYPAAGLSSIDASDLVGSVTLSAPRAQALQDDTNTDSEPQRLPQLPRFLVGVSSKAYFSHAQTISYVQSLLDFTPTDPALLRVFFIPSFPGVSTTSLLMQERCSARLAEDTKEAQIPFNLLLGAQDCHFAPAGAHTGSVPASELAELGCSVVELGHAERRRSPLCEDDRMVAAKSKMAVAAGLVPLVCIGEKNRPSTPRDAMIEIQPQLDSVFQAVGPDAHVILGYEPVWAIGQKEPAPAEYVCSVVDLIRTCIPRRSGDIKILYGGSAKPGIWGNLKRSTDGLFLGRFAHDVEALREIMKEMVEG